LLFSHFTPITRWYLHRVQLQPRRLLVDTTLVPLRRSLYRIDLSDPRRSIGQEGQSTDLCLQANPHTIRFARSCY
ncbi:hypothetical protein T4C_7186, partial [Trichinella pseudospiralis]